MAEEPRKVGVYDTDGNRTAPGGSTGMNWWIIALVVLVILVALYIFL